VDDISLSLGKCKFPFVFGDTVAPHSYKATTTKDHLSYKVTPTKGHLNQVRFQVH